MMLMGALSGFVASYFTGSPWFGIFCAIITATSLALLHAYLSVSLRINQVISGLIIWILGLGTSGYVFVLLFGVFTHYPTANNLGPIAIPLLSQIPFLGTALFDQNELVYLAFILVPVSAFILSKTTWGLKIRAVGENPKAADTSGVDVYRTRYLCVIFGGVMAGLAGGFLSLGALNLFVENMTAGRGWIAVAVVILGGWSAYKILGGCLLFGFAYALQYRLPQVGISFPPDLLLMLPYVLTVVALAIIAKKGRGPQALATSYKRGEAE